MLEIPILWNVFWNLKLGALFIVGRVVQKSQKWEVLSSSGAAGVVVKGSAVLYNLCSFYW